MLKELPLSNRSLAMGLLGGTSISIAAVLASIAMDTDLIVLQTIGMAIALLSGAVIAVRDVWGEPDHA